MRINLTFDFRANMRLLVPFKIRGKRFAAWIASLLTPLHAVNSDFAAVGSDIRYKADFTGQVVYLEHYLNDIYDSAQRRIYIDDPEETQIERRVVFNKNDSENTLIVGNKSEGLDTYLINQEAGVTSVDFIVHAPGTVFVEADELEWRAHINQYRIAGKTYTFETF